MSALSAAAQDEDGDTIKTLQARVADLEAQLYAVGAGGVGKMEQPQSVTDCHQSQPQGEQAKPVGKLMSDPYEGHLFVPRIDGDWSMLGKDLYTHPKPKRGPLTEADLYDIAGNYFADEWAQKQAVMMLKDHGIGGEA